MADADQGHENPDRERRLYHSIAKIESDVAEIKSNCKPCREEVGNHGLILSGRPGNSSSVGMVTRVSLLESNQKVFSEMREEARKDSEQARKDRERNIKWFRVQLASVIGALVLMLGVQGYDVCTHKDSNPGHNPGHSERPLDGDGKQK